MNFLLIALALKIGIVVNYMCAPVAQWIERRPPEPCARVRIAPGVLLFTRACQ